jgi:hypothetical protein
VTVTATNLDVQIGGSDTLTVQGAKSDNGGAPGSTNLGTLPAVALAADPTRTEGNQVALRTQLDGDLVTVMVDELPAGTQNIGDVDIVSFPDNEPFNLAQIAGTAPAAHDALMSGDAVPLTLAGFAETAEDSDANTNANRVSADADKTRLLTDRNGTLFVRNGPPHRWSYHENSSSALTDTTVHASCGTGLFNYIESVTASIGGATAFSLLIEDSTTTTIIGPYYLEAVNGRGFSVIFPGGRKQTTSATLIAVTTTGAVAHGIDITGFCAP